MWTAEPEHSCSGRTEEEQWSQRTLWCVFSVYFSYGVAKVLVHEQMKMSCRRAGDRVG